LIRDRRASARRTTTGASPLTTKSDAVGRDAFLKLLVTQLQHPEPLEPQPDRRVSGQLAQFSSLESLRTSSRHGRAPRSLLNSSRDLAGA
jgi:flagellar basal-body rod modification protein FlgD